MQESSILLPTAEAATLVGANLRTWYTWDQLGYIPKPIKIGAKLFWRRDELLEWIDAGCPKREDWTPSRGGRLVLPHRCNNSLPLVAGVLKRKYDNRKNLKTFVMTP